MHVENSKNHKQWCYLCVMEVKNINLQIKNKNMFLNFN